MGRTLEQLMADQPAEIVCSAELIASQQLIAIQLTEMFERLGTKVPDLSPNLAQTDISSGLLQLKRLVESGGGTLRLYVDLPDGSFHGFKL